MAEAEIIGRVLSYPTIYGDAVWEGSDAPVQLRIAERRTSSGASPTPYNRSDVAQITYSVARKTDEAYEYVRNYVDLEISKSASMPADAGNPEDWDFDTHGFNFSHAVPSAALDGPATHLILYRFELAAGTTIVQAVEIEVRAPCGTAATPGGSSTSPSPSPDPDPAPDDGVDSLLFSSITPVTVANTAVETTLLHAVNDVYQIDADSWNAGGVFSGEANGVLGTVEDLWVDLVLKVKLGSGIVLPFTILRGDIPTGQDDISWWLTWDFTLLTEGDSGTVYGSGTFEIVTEGGTVITRTASTGIVAIDTTAANAIAFTIDWGNADADNTITRVKFIGRMAEVPSV